MKKLLAVLLSLTMMLSLCGVVSVSGEETPEHEIPVIKKPVYVSVFDDAGNPVSGATVQVLDSDGEVVETHEDVDETFSVFLSAGEYTLKITDAPDGYILDGENSVSTLTVEVTEAEESDNIRGDTIVADVNNPYYYPFCISHNGTYKNRLEAYVIYDADETIHAFCFNQNYDSPDPEDPDASYKRLVGSPELFYFLAQNKLEGITAQELYDHVLSIIYHRDYIKEKYGFDDIMTDMVMGIAIKNFTDGNLDSLKTNDRDGNNMLLRESYPNGRPIYDENGNYQFRPGGCYLGSAVAHAMSDHKNDPDYVFPQEFKDAWDELIEMTDHPDDYYLYIYYPKSFHDRDYWREWTEENQPGAIAHYANLYYANDPQCMLSTFTVEPVRTSVSLRQATGIEITKTWADEHDQDGCRPTADEYVSMVKLKADGVDVTETYAEMRTVTDNGDETFTVRFEDLPKLNDDQKEINYTITEDAVDKYTADKTSVSDGGTITNTHVPETTEIEVHKIWDDRDDADGVRPDGITVNLLADEKIVQTVEVTPDENGNWSYTFLSLPKYRDHGVEIIYTVTEDPVEDYDSSVEGYSITNTRETETTEIEIHKTWEDEDDQDGIRPDSITVNLLSDGEIVRTVKVTPDENGDWSYTFAELPKNRDGGTQIEYTVTEEPVEDYDTEIDGYGITNKHTPETTQIEVHKIWEDRNDADGLRPDSITVNLLADDVVVQTVEITPDENGDWAYTFTGLPKYRDHGVEIVYTVTEEPVEDYDTEINGYEITNSYKPETTEIEILKTWDDADDQDGLRPDSITVKLLADGEIVDTAVITPDKNGDWSYIFTGLPKYRDGGVEIVYTVSEETVTSYTALIDGYTITNRHVPGTVDIPVSKVWDDGDDRDGLRPESITVNLLADGEIMQTVEITPDEEGNWSYTFVELPISRNGVKIVYSITEETVENYVSEVNGFAVTNHYTPETTEITVFKSWDDADDQDGLRPGSITVNLLADGEIVQTAEIVPDENGEWHHTFTDLLKYRDGGVEIVYTVTEESVAGYTTATDGYTLTNRHTPATVEIKVDKTWVDSDNKYESRPDSIVVRLLADGENVRTARITPDEVGNWTYTFKCLPKYKDGVEIKYTITEDPVKGYTTTIDGYYLTNTFTPPTGDHFNSALMFVLAGVSLLGLAALILVRRRRSHWN